MTDRNMISKFLRLRDSHSLGPAPGLLGVFQRQRHRVLRRRSLGPPARRQTDNLLRSHREISPYAKRDDVGDPIARTLPTATRSVRGASSPPTPYRSHSTACAGSRHVSRFRAKASSTFPAPERRTPGADRPSSVPKRQGLHCEARHRSVRDHRWKERRGDRRDGFDGRTKCQQVFGGRTSVIPQRRKNRGARARTDFPIDVLGSGAVLLGPKVTCDGFHADRAIRVQTHIHSDHMAEFTTSLRGQVVMTKATRRLLEHEYPALPSRTNVQVLEYAEEWEHEGDRIQLLSSDHALGPASESNV